MTDAHASGNISLMKSVGELMGEEHTYTTPAQHSIPRLRLATDPQPTSFCFSDLGPEALFQGSTRPHTFPKIFAMPAATTITTCLDPVKSPFEFLTADMTLAKLSSSACQPSACNTAIKSPTKFDMISSKCESRSAQEASARNSIRLTWHASGLPIRPEVCRASGGCRRAGAFSSGHFTCPPLESKEG
jgi:hypothetical protein